MKYYNINIIIYKNILSIKISLFYLKKFILIVKTFIIFSFTGFIYIIIIIIIGPIEKGRDTRYISLE